MSNTSYNPYEVQQQFDTVASKLGLDANCDFTANANIISILSNG